MGPDLGSFGRETGFGVCTETRVACTKSWGRPVQNGKKAKKNCDQAEAVNFSDDIDAQLNPRNEEDQSRHWSYKPQKLTQQRVISG